MAIITTTIGAFPKPEYVPTPDWFRDGSAGISNPTEAYQKYLAKLPDNIEDILDQGTRQAVLDQVDEPLFARKPDKALEYGFENLESCFHGLPGSVNRSVHICCGYPNYLDQENFQKADPMVYSQLSAAIESSCIQVISLEDAHRHNDLSLLENFKTTKVMLGVIAIASSRLETVEEITGRLQAALEHIDADRLIAAPDCGLGFLNRELALAKLTNMVSAAISVGN